MSNRLAEEVHFEAGEKGKVSGLLIRPEDARALLVLAHGAGAGMRHKFMEEISQKLANFGIATLRYQFPYMEKGIKRPDPETVLTTTVRCSVAAAKEHAEDLPLFAGGKSMGGRMTSLAAAKAPLESVRGLVLFGFPLHAAGKPSNERASHLFEVTVPMLFLQGSRDALADLKLLRPLCYRLGNRAELFVIEGGDHSFHMLKSSGKSDEQVLEEAARRVPFWISQT
ncbi:MAG: dienelactone hydrolase family protein [Deltaproteobacteria bacterium]|nr:dienelactone hydrolase family protein [Deltaproteobacteria bacterium]